MESRYGLRTPHGASRRAGRVHGQPRGRAVVRGWAGADPALVDHTLAPLGRAHGVGRGGGAEAEIVPERATGEAGVGNRDRVVHEEVDVVACSNLAAAGHHPVGEREAVLAAVPPEVVIAGHVDDLRVRQALSQPAEGLRATAPGTAAGQCRA